MTKMSVSMSPRALQHIAFTAVVLFGLVMSLAIHVTEKTVAEVEKNRYISIEATLDEAFLNDKSISTTTMRQ
ncbi:MAG: hypothetical protein WD335_01745 [Candidatus Paceibacterota bacterium]